MKLLVLSILLLLFNIIVTINYFIIMAIQSVTKKARGTILFYLAKIVYQTLCYSSCSCPLDSKIDLTLEITTLIGRGETKILKIAYPFVKMLFKFK